MVRKLLSTELLPAEEKTKPYGFLSSVDRRVAERLCSPASLATCFAGSSTANKVTGLSEKQASSFTEQALVLFGLLVVF